MLRVHWEPLAKSTKLSRQNLVGSVTLSSVAKLECRGHPVDNRKPCQIGTAESKESISSLLNDPASDKQ